MAPKWRETGKVGEKRGQRAVSGLLITCVVLSVGLMATAILSYRATRASAEAVLHSKASETAGAFLAAARMDHLFRDPKALDALAEKLSTQGVALTVINPFADEGASGASTNARPAVDDAVWATLRARGQAHRMREAGGETYLEYWRPFRGHRRRGWPFRPGLAPLDGARKWRHQRHGRPRGPPRLLRVTVSAHLATSLIRPARYATATAAAASVLLLVVGVALYRNARRALHVERELQQRESLAALGEMGAVLAHEIRTPLASVKGNAQLVAESHPGDDARIAAIIREAERLERLVNGLLAYARPKQPNWTVTDPDELAGRAVQIVAPVAQKLGIPILQQGAERGACLETDPDQLLQVLVNLLQNAVEANAAQAADDGREPVTFTVQCRGSEVVFSVLDRGNGIDASEMDTVFRPFHTTKSGGTGLGLSVAKQIVQSHGGRIELAARSGGGTVATVGLRKRGKGV